eukprot:222850-Chlamydomonas_euryale.AAC.2
MDVCRTFVMPFFLYGCETWTLSMPTWTEAPMGRLGTDPSVDGARIANGLGSLAGAGFCSIARSVAEDGRVEQLKLRPGRRKIKDFSGMHSSAIWGCHAEGSSGGTTGRDFLKLPGPTLLIPWPEIRAAAAERALDRHAWRDAIQNLAPFELEKPQQVGRMTRSCARRGESG